MNATSIKVLVLFLMLGCCQSRSKRELTFAEQIPEKFNKAYILQEKDYNVWGTNIIKGKDGQYHAIYSRWPKSRGNNAWVTHSEIAHAVSDKLTGPYVFKDLALPPRGIEYWDGHCTHNPHIVEHEGRYYLYHMGNRGSGYWDVAPDTLWPDYVHDEWWVNRNNQRVGAAVADDINGPWKRSDKPLVDIDSTRKMTSTPVVSKRPDGKFLMVYKYVVEDGTPRGGRVIHVTALADNPLGPFEDTGIPFIETTKSKFALDDHVEWFQHGMYHCIGKDHDGALTEYGKGTTVLYTSDEKGMDWKLAENPLIFKHGALNWTDGTTTLCRRNADMPKVYLEDGEAKALIFAVFPEKSDTTWALITPLIKN